MPKILLVKTSSMGDVIHNLPVVSDIQAHLADAQIDWVVEETFAGIPGLHPGVANVIPVAIRRWRKTFFTAQTASEMRVFRKRLRQQRYDIVLDTQGLIKSGFITRLAHGLRCGYAWDSAREPAASLLYNKTFHVAKLLHAVERNRALAAQVFAYRPEQEIRYGIQLPALSLPWLPAQPYAVLMHATSRAAKEWPEANWIALGQHFNRNGLTCVLLWGSDQEAQRSHRLAQQISAALVPSRLSFIEMATMLKGARIMVGVDTGITHLAAACGTPVVAIYGASDPALTGVYTSGHAINLGGAGAAPQLTAVLAACDKLLTA